MSVYKRADKVCATCALWGGSRELTRNNTVDARANSSGPCKHPKKPFGSHEPTNAQKCGYWISILG